jgi:predicted dehydrogenase
VTVSATGAAYLQAGRPDVAFAALRFADGRMAHVHVSWLAPGRRRALTVVGTRRMLTFDEGAAERPLLLHERARGGAVEALPVPELEPLAAECDHFLECVARGGEPRGGPQAMGVMRVLDAGERSMRAGGAPVEVA